MGFLDRFRRAKASPVDPQAPAFTEVRAAPRRRGFDAAKYNRMVEGWVASSTSLDEEIRRSLKRMRARSRDLAMNNDHAKNALRIIANNVVGTGVQLQAMVPMERGTKLDTKANEAIEAAWARWKRADTCHTAGLHSFAEIERLAVRTVAMDGEVFIRKIRRPFGSGRVPLALELIDADRLDSDHNAIAPGGNEIRMGVERDQWGRPIAYHFDTENPNDLGFVGLARRRQKIRVPADDVIHLFSPDSVAQTRGVPWFATAILRLHHLAGFTEAEVIAARAEACRMGFITSPDDQAMQDGEEADGTALSSFEPGRIERLVPGESYTEAKPTRPGGQFEPFVRVMLRSMAAGMGVSYASLTRDYTGTNYSSSRLDLLDERDNWKSLQAWIIAKLHANIYEEWFGLAVLAGELPFPRYELRVDAYQRARWVPRGWAWIDPVKEVGAFKEAIRGGLTTQADVIAQNGGDFEDIIRQRAYEIEQAAENKLTFDTDPAKIAANGAAVAAPADPVEDVPST